MAVICRSPNSWRCAARLATFVMVFTVAWVVVARAQIQNPPYSLFQYSTLTGSGSTITATRVPVVTAAGNTIYKNITMQFDVDSDGNLTLSSSYPLVFDEPALVVSGFKAGNYAGPGSILKGKATGVVGGPTALEGGASSWSFASAAGADPCTYPSSATWYVGPIANSPVAARLTKAGITSTAWSYGVASGPGGDNVTCGDGASSGNSLNQSAWRGGTLIGVSQSGNAITIASFTERSCSSCDVYDKGAPVEQITYRLAP